MNPRDQSRRSRFRPIGGRGYLPLLAGVLMALGGCESGFGSKREGDPMLGVHGPASPTPVAGTPNTNNAGVQVSSGPVPQLPASISAPSTAAVAAGESAVSDNARDLRINTGTISPTSLPTSGAARGAAPVTVGSPEPASPGTTSNLVAPPASGGLGMPTPTPPPPPGTASTIRTYEDAQRVLKQHGVNWQKLRGDEGEWIFACGIPNPRNPRMNRTYQTSKPFPDELSAIRAVLAEIEQTPH